MNTALSIAGSDCSGGAGIQADLKTMTLNGVYAMSAITALTAQNTTGVSEITAVTPHFLRQQLDMIFTDIFPDAVKIGMVPSAELMETVWERLSFYQAKNIVVDPVMASTSGTDLMKKEALSCLKASLLPMARLITPNIPEAEALSGMKIESRADMARAAAWMEKQWGCAVLLKGGHMAGRDTGQADDLLCAADTLSWLPARHIPNPNTHGTGCTLSSAIAANLAKGMELEQAVRQGKAYITGAIAAGLNLGKGRGPLNHAFDLHSRFAETPASTKGETK